MSTPDASTLLARRDEGLAVYAACAPADPLVLVLPKFATAVVDGESVQMRAPKNPWGVYVVSPNADGSVGVALRGSFPTIEDATAAAIEVRDSEERPEAIK